MLRLFVVLLLLMSFGFSALADDTCCFEEQNTSIPADNIDNCGEHSTTETKEECLNCIRCSNSINFMFKQFYVAEPLITVATLDHYKASNAPSPSLVSHLRPPIRS